MLIKKKRHGTPLGKQMKRKYYDIEIWRIDMWKLIKSKLGWKTRAWRQIEWKMNRESERNNLKTTEVKSIVGYDWWFKKLLFNYITDWKA